MRLLPVSGHLGIVPKHILLIYEPKAVFSILALCISRLFLASLSGRPELEFNGES